MTRTRRHTPTRPKVVAAAAGATAGVTISAFVVWCLDGLFWNGAAAPDVPTPVVGMVGLAITSGLAFAAGWLKRDE